MINSNKFCLVEYGDGIPIPNEALPLIEPANKIIQQSLKLKRNVLVVTEGKLRALGIAGMIRLSKDYELEIIPKIFEGTQHQSDWKESLLLMSVLSKHGNLIPKEYIHSSTAYKDTLYDIVGRILAQEFFAHRRKLIRKYQHIKFKDFSIDGEIDFENVFERDPDGISQEKVYFDKKNQYNATIQAAMKIVLPYVREPSIYQLLQRSIQELGNQHEAQKIRLKVPARNSEWKDIYNLASDIVSGMGMSLDDGKIMSPGFIADTWQIWEWLITTALQVGLEEEYQVLPQATTQLGTMITKGKESCINVYPDVKIYRLSTPLLLVDAKYKIISGKGDVERSDLYEAFAYCQATKIKKLFLAYPTTTNDGRVSGSIECIVKYKIEDITISAITIAFGPIERQGDIRPFCRTFSQEITSLIEN